MIKTRLRYCVYDPDPRGNDRYYARKPGFKKIRIREQFEDVHGNITEAFMKAYFAALASFTETAPPKKETRGEDTFNWLVDKYMRSPEVQKLDKMTQKDKRSVLNRYCLAGSPPAGKRPYRAMRREHVMASQNKRSATPGAADKLVKVLRAMFNWAMKQSPPLMTHNPATGVEKINKSDGFHTWTPAEIEQYRAYHALGTTPRLALELMLNVGARISDAAVLGPQHDDGGVLHFTAQKNRNRSPTVIDVPMLPELVTAIRKSKIGNFTYLITEYGLAFTKDGLGNRVREWCDSAGLPQCSSHGLRKAAAVEHAENGTTAMEMCALFGWTKLETAETYIRAAQKKAMARNAIERLEERRKNKSVSLSPTENVGETKRRKNRAKSKPKSGGGGPGGPT